MDKEFQSMAERGGHKGLQPGKRSGIASLTVEKVERLRALLLRANRDLRELEKVRPLQAQDGTAVWDTGNRSDNGPDVPTGDRRHRQLR